MFKSNLVAGLIGIVLMCGFLGILLVWLKVVPLTIIVLLVIAMMIYDFYKELKQINGGAGR